MLEDDDWSHFFSILTLVSLAVDAQPCSSSSGLLYRYCQNNFSHCKATPTALKKQHGSARKEPPTNVAYYIWLRQCTIMQLANWYMHVAIVQVQYEILVENRVHTRQQMAASQEEVASTAPLRYQIRQCLNYQYDRRTQYCTFPLQQDACIAVSTYQQLLVFRNTSRHEP